MKCRYIVDKNVFQNSNNTELEKSICDKKKSYDKDTAITVANKRFREDHVHLRIYPCGDHWHLTKHTMNKWQVSKKNHRMKNLYRH